MRKEEREEREKGGEVCQQSIGTEVEKMMLLGKEEA